MKEVGDTRHSGIKGGGRTKHSGKKGGGGRTKHSCINSDSDKSVMLAFA